MNNKFWQEFLDMYPRAKSATMIEYTSTMKDGTIVKGGFYRVNYDLLGAVAQFKKAVSNTPNYKALRIFHYSNGETRVTIIKQ